MNRTTLPLSEIIVNERFRRDYGDLSSLKDSIKTFGLLQPVLIDQNKTLMAGGRRYTAHVELGLTTIDVTYRETLSDAERQEIEAIENIIRKNFTWQEEAVAIRRIHLTRRINAMLGGGDTWNTRLACELFGVSKGALGYVLEVATRLEAELKLPEDQRPYHNYNSCAEAYRVGILGEQEKRALDELAKRHKRIADALPTQSPAQAAIQKASIAEVTKAESSPDALAFVRERYYSNPHNPPDSFESYWKTRQEEKVIYENSIYLSNRLFNESCIDHMNAFPGCYDHIITDIPYGVDVEMMDQSSGALADLDRIAESHQVEENMQLMELFFPAAFKCTKERAFVITYCDIMQWQYMFDLATSAGFNVQRWPIIWHKQSGGGNKCAQYNSTKNYDILMVCRKPGSVLLHPLPSSIILASHEQARIDCKHPFSKPYDITRILADAISNKGETFIEPFAGGGSIALELTRQERNVVCTEKDAHHYNLLLENYKQFYLKLNPNTIFK